MSITGQTTKYVNNVDNWDVQTASLFSSFSTASQTSELRGVAFKPDGSTFYTINTNTIYEYALGTAWNISTASFTQSSFATSNIRDIFFRADGLKLYLIRSSTSTSAVLEYNLTTAWDISTIDYVQLFLVNSQDTNPSGLFFNEAGTSFYITGIS